MSALSEALRYMRSEDVAEISSKAEKALNLLRDSSPAKYLYRVFGLEKTDNGYIGYDSLNVVVKKNIINNITPQPATDFAVINYQIMQANNAYIEITNSFGTVLENFQINTELNQYSFDCSSLPSGIYTVILYCDGNHQDAKNLIIE